MNYGLRKLRTADRARLLAGKQRLFIVNAISHARNIENLATFLNVSPRTIRDWRREKFLIPYSTIILLARTHNLPLPEVIKREPQFWYVEKGARKGGLASYKKQGGTIGDPAKRKARWLEWWRKEGKAKMPETFYPLPFYRAKPSINLAEFFGIAMGDGGMTDRQLTITLHHINDLAYSKFVVVLIKKLFHITPSVRHIPETSVNLIVISRTGLVNYLHELGLPIGNKVKQNFNIPQWIQQNERYMVACLRGLVDTDGSVFTHTYRSNGKRYSYKKLSFCSASPPLRNTVKAFLKNHGFAVRASRGIDLRIESKAGIKLYMDLIGSHNPKHLKRYAN